MVSININGRLLRSCILLIPIPVIGLFLLLKKLDFMFYRKLMAEDSVIEYLTSGFYFLSFVIAITIFLSFWKLAMKPIAILYFLLSLAMFFIFGEEISWGQRIFNLESPEYFMENNRQKELTVHNLYPIQYLLHSIYILIGAFGAFLWIAVFFIKQLRSTLIPYLIPNWYLMTYFLPVVLFYTYYDYIMETNNFLDFTHREQEPSEFFLSIGFFLFILINRFRQKIDFNISESKTLSVKWITKGRA